MKKIISFIAVAVMIVAVSACGNRAPKAEVSEQVDTTEVVADSLVVAPADTAVAE